MAEVRLEPLPFAEAIEFFRQKGYALSPNSWRDVWAEAHAKAFTVAKVASMDLLQDIRAMVDKALADGVSLTDFKQNFLESLSRKGWAGAKPWRAEVIYRTNLQSAYNTGRYRQMLEVADRRPYWMYSAVLDSRVRPSHAALHGVICRFDDPFWQRFYPPNGFNCRCTVRTLSEKDLQRRGLRITEKLPVGVEPDEGFDYNPGQAAWEPDLSKYGPEARRMLQAQGIMTLTTITTLSSVLNRIKEALMETGMPATGAPISVIEDPHTKLRGWANYQTGQIGLNSSIYGSVRDILRQRSALTADDIGDFKTLVHEFGHQLGLPIDSIRYGVDNAYCVLSQTINDLWARHNTANVLRILGIPYDVQVVKNLIAVHESGYQQYVERFRQILSTAGLDDVEQRALVTRLNLTIAPEDYSNELWRELVARKPALRPEGDFGHILVSEDRFQWLLDQLRR